MIPKRIHYSWFSDDPYPEAALLYMETWKKFLPDYEFILWNKKRIEEIDSIFLKEALQESKWAFAADYVRCHAVYQYGGIWLDIDVEMRQSFDAFLHHRMFIGQEDKADYISDGIGRCLHSVTSHCFGAEAGHPFLKRCLDYYKDRRFILSNDRSLPERLRYDMRVLPDIQACLLNSEFGYYGGVKIEDDIETINEGIVVYPYWYFEQPKFKPIESAVCIHHFFGAWRPENYGKEYKNKGLYQSPQKDIYYYGFTFLNRWLKRRGMILKVFTFGQ